jgi:hypothetical protein
LDSGTYIEIEFALHLVEKDTDPDPNWQDLDADPDPAK